MDFNSLGENSPVYVVRKKPFQFLTGTLKSKVSKQPSNPYMPQAAQQPIDVIISVGGSDETIPSVPTGMEVVEYKGSYYSTTADGAQQAISGLMQVGRDGIDNQPYFNSLITEGEKALEDINPQYAEGKRQARVVKELQERQDAQDRKLDKILAFMQDLTGSPKE
jgi:hypothetical protein